MPNPDLSLAAQAAGLVNSTFNGPVYIDGIKVGASEYENNGGNQLPLPFSGTGHQWGLPLLNEEKHVVRNEYIEKIENRFQNLKKNKIVVLATSGTGGMGKTQLALGYAYGAQNKYFYRVWFEAETEKSLELKYKQFGEMLQEKNILKVSNKYLYTNATDIVKEWFEQNPGWLIVYDNVTNYADLERFLPNRGGCILVTSRITPKASWYGKELVVEKMKPIEGNELVSKILTTKNSEEALELVNSFDGFPLMLEVAASYIKETGSTIKEYIQNLKQNKINFQNPYDILDKHLTITFNSLTEKSQKPLVLLNFCAHLYAESISKNILGYLLEWSLDEINSSLSMLHKYSFISYNRNSTVKIHRTIQECLKRRQGDEETFRYIMTFIQRVRSYVTKSDRTDLIDELPEHVNFILTIVKENYGESSTAYNELIRIYSELHLRFSAGNQEILTLSPTTYRQSVTYMRYLPDQTLKDIMFEHFKSMSKTVEGWSDRAVLNMIVADVVLSVEERKLLHDKTIKTLENILQTTVVVDKKVEVTIKCLLAGLKNFRNELEYDQAVSLRNEVERSYGANSQLMVIIRDELVSKYRIMGKYKEAITEAEEILKVIKYNLPNDNPYLYFYKLKLGYLYYKIGNATLASRFLTEAYPLVAAYFQGREKLLYDVTKNHTLAYEIISEINIHGLDVLNKWENDKNSLSNRIIQFVENNNATSKLITAYYSAPVNLSSVTGVRYPLIPRLRGNVFLGHLNSKFNEAQFFSILLKSAELAESHQRKLSYFWLADKLVLLVIKPEDIKQVLETHREEATREIPFKSFAEILGSDNIFLARNEDARHQRGWLKENIYKKQSLEKIFSKMSEVIAKKVTENVDKPIDIKVFFNHLAMSIFSIGCMGVESINENDAEQLSNGILETFRESMQPTRLFKKQMMSTFVHNDSTSSLKEKLKNIFIKHLMNTNHDSIFGSHNLITDIHNAFHIKNPEISIDDVYSKVCTLLIAGHETTSSTFQFMVKLLEKHPKIKQKIKKEIADKIGGSEVSFENISGLRYLKMVIKETLRLYPPVVLIPRGVEKSFYLQEVNPSYEKSINTNSKNEKKVWDIPVFPGDIIAISPYIVHRQKSLWGPDAAEFVPERHQNDKNLDIGPGDYKYLPFGAGKRDCIGWKFAEQELMLFFVMLYKNHDIIINENDFEVEWVGTLKLKNPTIAAIKRIEDISKPKAKL